MMSCPDCGADLDNVPIDQPCPRCGSARRDATICPPTVEATAEVFPPTITVETLWDTGSLTFAAVVYTAAITIIGVLIASLRWPWRVGYAVSAVTLLALGLTVLKAPVIRVSRRIVGRLNGGPPL